MMYNPTLLAKIIGLCINILAEVETEIEIHNNSFPGKGEI